MYAEWAPGDENYYAGFEIRGAIVTLGLHHISREFTGIHGT
jgi:hypothetical protein